MGTFGSKLSVAAGQNRRSRRPYERIRSALAVLLVLTFAAQNFIAQTHIHGITQQSTTAFTSGKPLSGPAQGKLPADQDEKNCPLCCLSAFVGSCVIPLPATVLPAQLFAQVLLLQPARLLFVVAISFSWQVRGPPR